MRLVVTGGGTGGHLFPGLAVARAVQEDSSGSQVLFISTTREIDQKILSGEAFGWATLQSSGLKGYSLGARVKSLLMQPIALYKSIRMLQRFRAELVFAVGGYVTGPVILAAKILRIPVCIHEQNSVPGLANRLAGNLADVICTSIPCGDYFPLEKVVQTGNPVREEIRDLYTTGDHDNGSSIPTVLILGGSQGAHRVNELVVEAVRLLTEKGVALKIVHQTGERDAEMVKSAYNQLHIQANVQPFIADMASCYRKADVAVSRAGATTLAELAIAGVPAVLIPYPYAADDHQMGNAQYYVGNGGCEVHKEDSLNAIILAQRLTDLLTDPNKLHQMSVRMRETAMPNATENLVRQCQQLVNNGS